MKFMQTIIAFLTVYLFLSVVAGILLVAYWLRGFTPDIEKQTLAKVTIESVDPKFGAGYVYKTIDAANALEVMVTRDISSASKNENAVLAARSTVMVATYTKVNFAEMLVPLGFRSMYKLTSISDASGKNVYKMADPILEVFLKTGVAAYEQEKNPILHLELVSLPLVASSTPITYTITVDDSGLRQEIVK